MTPGSIYNRSAVPTATITHTPYRPFGLPSVAGATLRVLSSPHRSFLEQLRNGEVECRWPLRTPTTRPGHGLLLLPFLRIRPGDYVADLGCGPIALFSVFAVWKGASQCLAIDIEEEFCDLRSLLSSDPLLLDKIVSSKSDLLSEIPNAYFDVIAFHPPMLPVPTELSADEVRHSRYDFGGVSGRETLDIGIRQAASRLRYGGRLVIGQFEFLGSGERYGNHPCTTSVALMYGLSVEEQHKIIVPITDTILGSMDRIRAHYPEYRFVQIGPRIYHEFTVLVLRRGSARSESAWMKR